MQSITEEIVREILLKLPTRDVARCRCVSSQWRGLLTDPSFIHLHVHALHVVSGSSGTQALIATQTRSPRIGLEMVIRDVSSGKPMCRLTDLDTHYRIANACNGFLLLAPTEGNRPVYLCNPITGEKHKIVPPTETEDLYRRSYAMGFSSPSSGVYKLFRLCFRDPADWSHTWNNYMEVYTFVDKGGESWRRHPRNFWCCIDLFHQMPPVLLDGRLYVLMEQLGDHHVHPMLRSDIMLVIDVASEAHGTYRLPQKLAGEVTASAHAFDMGGRLCIARRIASTNLLRFWVLEPPRGQQQLDHVRDKCQYGTWELRYTFKVDECGGGGHDEQASGAWLDNGDEILCYRLGDCLYIYDTTRDQERKKIKKEKDGDFSKWDDKIPLPATPSSDDQRRWNVYGCYRPSLFSPHDLVYRRNNDDQEKYEHDLAQAMRGKQFLMKRMAGPSDCSVHPIRCAKRVRS